MKKRALKVAGVLGVLLVSVTVVLSVVAQDCFMPLRISGAGTAAVNGTAYFAGVADGRPFYIGANSLVEWDSGAREWVIFDTSGGSAVSVYSNGDNEATPPRRGWSTTGGASPSPTVSGGEPCPVIVPTGDVGNGRFLDRSLDLAEGEGAPLVGGVPLSAVYAVGETVTGSCQILDPEDEDPVLSYVHLYVYSVETTTGSERKTLLDHWMAPHDWATREYLIAWDTSGLLPGIYDLRLSFEGARAVTLRIELVPPEE